MFDVSSCFTVFCELIKVSYEDTTIPGFRKDRPIGWREITDVHLLLDKNRDTLTREFCFRINLVVTSVVNGARFQYLAMGRIDYSTGVPKGWFTRIYVIAASSAFFTCRAVERLRWRVNWDFVARKSAYGPGSGRIRNVSAGLANSNTSRKDSFDRRSCRNSWISYTRITNNYNTRIDTKSINTNSVFTWSPCNHCSQRLLPHFLTSFRFLEISFSNFDHPSTGIYK